MAGQEVSGTDLRAPKSNALSAILLVRWQILANSLRGVRGKVNMATRITMWIIFAAAGVGGAIGLEQQAAHFISQGRPELLAVLLWPVFIFWQVFPLLTTAFSENLDSVSLLRFPIRYQSYFLLRVVSGSLDAATALGILWLIGIGIGIGSADKRVLARSTVTLLIFAILNVLLARTIFVWLENWLAQRRTRELMAVLFFFLIISLQLVGPLMPGSISNRVSTASKPPAHATSRIIISGQRFLPPGLAGESIASRSQKTHSGGVIALCLLISYTAAFFCLLHIPLHAQFRGEHLSRAPSSTAGSQRLERRYAGWQISGVSSASAVVLEKEFRYLSRSGPVLLTLLTPVFMLLILRNPARSGFFLGDAPQYAFPVATAYSLMLLANLIYNLFGADGQGMLLFYTSPASFKEIVMAKNFSHVVLLVVNFAMAGVAAALLFSAPPIDVAVGTMAWILFAVPINLATGNVISIVAPKKLDWGTFGRQRASRIAIVASFAVQIFTVSTGVGILLLSSRMGKIWFATPILLVLATFSLAGYGLVLNRVDALAHKYQENLIFELAKS